MAPFYGWGSTASRLEPLQGGSLLFTTFYHIWNMIWLGIKKRFYAINMIYSLNNTTAHQPFDKAIDCIN